MKRFFLASACAAVLAFSVAAPPALATVRTMTVKNDSTSCAWITIYEAAHTFLPWQIVHSTYGHPRLSNPAAAGVF
jgi:hypothetical protein